MTTLMSTLMPTLMMTLMANNINVDINDIIILMTRINDNLLIIDVTEFLTAVHY
jgi:hypothetical protein